jgi:hypothetical protein
MVSRASTPLEGVIMIGTVLWHHDDDSRNGALGRLKLLLAFPHRLETLPAFVQNEIKGDVLRQSMFYYGSQEAAG